LIITWYQVKGPKLKAAVVADLHGKPSHKLYDALKAEQPDVILIPGDLATVGEYKDWSIDPDRLERIRKTQESAIEFLRTAVTIAPTFYARGNHEWANPDDVYFEKVRRTGAVLLENEWTKFGEVWIGGQSSAKRYGLEALIEKNPPPDTEWLKDSPTDFKLLLCHHPEYYSLIKDYADCIVA